MIYGGLRLLGVAGIMTCVLGIAQAQTAAPSLARINAARSLANSSPRQAVSGASAGGISVGLHSFARDMGRMLTAAEGLDVLITRPPGATNWRGPYISTNNWKAPLTDPWGVKYRYVVTPAGRTNLYSIVSNGPDRTPGTKDDLSIQF